MPNSCAAFGCSNHNLMENKPGFYRFPNNNPERRKMWISACKRKNKDGTADWNPTGKNVYLCGKHFTTEKNKKKIERFESAKKRSLAKARTPVAPKKQRTLNFVSPGKPPLQQSNTFISPPLSPCSSTTSLMSPLPEMPEMEVDFSLSSQTQHLTPVTISRPTTLNASTQNTSSILDNKHLIEITNLTEALQKAKITVNDLESKFICYEHLKKKPAKFKYNTGINKDQFDTVFDMVKDSLPKKFRSKMPFKDQLLMTLAKLRLNLQFENMADQFNCPRSTAHEVFQRWIDLLSTKLSWLIHWPDHDASIHSLPNVFRQYFPRLTGIIDCTEIFIDRPKKSFIIAILGTVKNFLS
ncbi:uncharacterized protein LOC130648287 [Hydractinia symbiolongicarpus]|uniref:uncharacterized protein LOC130648287 n=1 Tax=Hydractinia symbiolongicarpus TaxID=13093 RepID=UPI00255037BD|nr:uncharacterized protein LOC130648287 [Hydractinia symbiolongicarpus]